MEIKIFNVEHGFFACAIADNKNIIVIDCGHNASTGFRPSQYLPSIGCNTIEKFIVSNFDEDHVSDFHNLVRVVNIEVFSRNPDISAETLRKIKSDAGPITPGMESLIQIHAGYTGGVTNPPDFAGITLSNFWNQYPTFTDTNNLSYVTFLEYNDFCIIFPGDMEKSGWENLLSNPGFQTHLKHVDVFVASHHGRENGYCEDIFTTYGCNPDIFIISDTIKQYQTQERDYSPHANGVSWSGGGKRYVLTTRSDGAIAITKNGYNPYEIRTNS